MVIGRYLKVTLVAAVLSVGIALSSQETLRAQDVDKPAIPPAKLPYGRQHYPPMPEQDANVLQVLVGQMAKRSDTDSVFSKALRILGRNLLHCGALSLASLWLGTRDRSGSQ